MTKFLAELRHQARRAGENAILTLLLALLGTGLSILALLDNPISGAVVVGALLLAVGIFAAATAYTAGEGLYTYVEADDEWDIQDDGGQLAINTKRRKIKYLQDEVFAIRDYAWGTGTIGPAKVKAGPGRAVRDYTRDNRHHTIILLDGIRKRGNEDEFTIVREFKGSFVDPATESVQLDVLHTTDVVRSKIVFPAGRPPTRAWVTRKEGQVEVQDPLTPEPAGGGRQQIAWSRERPPRYAVFTIGWTW